MNAHEPGYFLASESCDQPNRGATIMRIIGYVSLLILFAIGGLIVGTWFDPAVSNGSGYDCGEHGIVADAYECEYLTQPPLDESPRPAKEVPVPTIVEAGM